MIFDAKADQISRLDSLQLVQLMKRLLLAECQQIDVPLRAANVPVQITMADGGEDGRVEWSGGVGATNYFPARFCIFQAKAQNLTEATIKAEVVKKPKKGRARLNAAVSKVLSRKGAYIVFCSHAFSGQKIEKLQRRIEVAIRMARKSTARAAAIEVYDANRIADWVNIHPGVALWLAELQRGRSLAGFKSHESWGRDPTIYEIPWIADDDTPRFAPENVLIDESERKDRSRNAWTFQQTAEAISRFLAKDKAVLRIVGPSGFGKTRFAFELFNRRITTSDEIEKMGLIYADLGIVGDDATKLAHEIADSDLPAFLVVDECSDETHGKLAETARRAGSRLSLVTIDVETKVVGSADTFLLRLEPASDETIGAIARSVAPELTDTRFIQDLAKGFPKMAVLAAQQRGIGAKAIRSAQQVIDRIIWGRRPHDNEAQRAIELLSLFDWVGLTGKMAGDGAFIAEKLGEMTGNEFIERIKSFGSRGIIVERGDFVQVAPIPLAANLGAHRLSIISLDRLVTFFWEAPDRLKQSLLRRFRWLDTFAEAKAFARKLLDPEWLGKLDNLNTDFGAECLDHLVHIDPDFVMTTIQRVFGSLTSEELRSVRLGQRHLVWALEKLVFRKETFDVAATLLRRLAASETEGNIFNNAAGQFTQLYHLYLSGTEAPPEARLRVLDEGLRSPNPKEREVCIEALDKMLDTGHFARGGGAEEVGSGEPLKDWMPETYGDIWEFQRAALTRLTDRATSGDPLAVRAKQILGAHIRGLTSTLPFDDVKEMISCIISRDGFWIEAVQEINQWLYFDRGEETEELGKVVRAFFDELMPSDPVELVVLYSHGWQTDFADPDSHYDRQEPSQADFEYATRKSVELAEVIATDPTAIDRALDILSTSDAKTIFPFARRLAELVSQPIDLFKSAVAKAEQKDKAANYQFFGGLIAGTDNRDQHAARDCIRLALRSATLKDGAISLIGAGRLQPGDIHLVVSLLQSDDIEPRQCALLSYGRGMDHLATEKILPLLEELGRHGGDGLWTVLDIIAMISHGQRELPGGFLGILRNVLVDPALFDNPRGTMDGHHLETIVKLLSRDNLIDRGFAHALVTQLLSICTESRTQMFNKLVGPIATGLKALIDAYPQEVWASVVHLLQDDDWRVQRQLKRLLGLRHNNHLGAGLLYALPADLFLDWAREDPARRVPTVMAWLPIATQAEDGSLSWHPALRDFVAEFGNPALRALSMHLQPGVYWGSLVPQLESVLKLLDSWSSHRRSDVRQWVDDERNRIRAKIQDEQRREAEDSVRFL